MRCISVRKSPLIPLAMFENPGCLLRKEISSRRESWPLRVCQWHHRAHRGGPNDESNRWLASALASWGVGEGGWDLVFFFLVWLPGCDRYFLDTSMTNRFRDVDCICDMQQGMQAKSKIGRRIGNLGSNFWFARTTFWQPMVASWRCGMFGLPWLLRVILDPPGMGD